MSKSIALGSFLGAGGLVAAVGEDCLKPDQGGLRTKAGFGLFEEGGCG